jgi:hypothetical protein
VYRDVDVYFRHSGMVRKDQTSGVQLHTGESRDSGFTLRVPRNDGA